MEIATLSIEVLFIWILVAKCLYNHKIYSQQTIVLIFSKSIRQNDRCINWMTIRTPFIWTCTLFKKNSNVNEIKSMKTLCTTNNIVGIKNGCYPTSRPLHLFNSSVNVGKKTSTLYKRGNGSFNNPYGLCKLRYVGI